MNALADWAFCSAAHRRTTGFQPPKRGIQIILCFFSERICEALSECITSLWLEIRVMQRRSTRHRIVFPDKVTNLSGKTNLKELCSIVAESD